MPFDSSAQAVIDATMITLGQVDSEDLPLVHAHEAAHYRDEHPGVRYEWWTQKTGPGKSVIMWRLTKENS